MIDLLKEDASEYVSIEKLSVDNVPDSFSVYVPEYSEYITKNALKLQSLFVSNTYILKDNRTQNIIGYVSLICDSVVFTSDEKAGIKLDDVPYSTFPALKIAQLAVSDDFKNIYCHVGSFLIDFAFLIAYKLNENSCACRFLTVDADIENNSTVVSFYEKNGFKKMTDKKYTKRTKTVCMWKDILS